MAWPRIFFLTLTLALLVAAAVFLYRRLVRDTVRPRWLRVALGALLGGLVLSVPAQRLLFRESLPPAEATTAVLLGVGVFLYLFMILLVVELVRWLLARRRPATSSTQAPADPGRRLVLSRAVAAGALATSGGLTAYGSWRAFTPPEISEVPVRLPGLPKALEGFTIVQLSDIHVGTVIQEKFLDQLVRTANSAKPDLVAITGDLVDGSPAQLGRYVARLRNLSSRYGTHFVSGNHDYYSGWPEWARVLEGMDFTVLRNRYVAIGEPGASFDLVGVDDWHGDRMGDEYDLDKATAGRDPARASVLMAHQPSGIDLAEKANLGLQLSGHTHGGQLFPATLIGDVIWGARNTGLSRSGSLQIYTSRGCGFVGPPMRVGAPPEVVKLVLLPA